MLAPRRVLPWVGALAFLMLAARAEAHSVISTKGPFIGGLKHFFLSLDDVLVALALGFVASQNQAKAANKIYWALPCAWILAGLAGLMSRPAVPAGEIISAGSLLVSGGLAAASLALAARTTLVLAAIMGTLHGFLNGAAMHPDSFWAGFLQLLGIGACVAFVAIYPSSMLDIFKQHWVRIAVRVMGSWIAATGLLLIGWIFRLRK